MQEGKRDFNSLVSFHALRTEILAREALGAGRQFEANFLLDRTLEGEVRQSGGPHEDRQPAA